MTADLTKPIFALSQIAQLREEFQLVCSCFCGMTLDSELIKQLLDRLMAVSPTMDTATVFDSIRYLADRPFTAELGTELAWRLAGNQARLKKGITVSPWTGKYEKEWVPFQVIHHKKRNRSFTPKDDVQAMRASKDGKIHRRGYVVKLKCLAGIPAGRVIEKFWSHDQCEKYKELFGFSKFVRYSRNVSRRQQFPFADGSEFQQMIFYGLLDPTLARDGEFDFKEVKGTAAAKTECRRIQLMRMRVDETFACPRGYPDSFDCYRCSAGLNECPAACRAKTLTTGTCPRCKKEDSQFDPLDSSGLCVDCAVTHD